MIMLMMMIMMTIMMMILDQNGIACEFKEKPFVQITAFLE